ncbi:MAG: glycosyltransferase [Bdellovibrionota bacterium]
MYLILTPSISLFDAVSNDVLMQARCLEDNGKEVIIGSEFIDQNLSGKVYSVSKWLELIKREDLIIIYHHSVFWNLGYRVFDEAKGRIVFRYHNITPWHFFSEKDKAAIYACKKGRSQTEDLVNSGKIDSYISASQYNDLELKKIGADPSKMHVVAPFHKVNELISLEKIGKLENIKQDCLNILFVGRVAPNKGHVDLVRVLSKYIDFYDEKVHLHIIGNYMSSDPEYLEEIEDAVNYYGIAEYLTFYGKVSLDELKSFYSFCDVFLILSHHEGFCVPIIEAQSQGLPVVALNATAVKDTVGDGQLSCDQLKIEWFVAAIREVARNDSLKKKVIENGFINFRKYELSILESTFIDIVSSDKLRESALHLSVETEVVRIENIESYLFAIDEQARTISNFSEKGGRQKTNFSFDFPLSYHIRKKMKTFLQGLRMHQFFKFFNYSYLAFKNIVRLPVRLQYIYEQIDRLESKLRQTDRVISQYAHNNIKAKQLIDLMQSVQFDLQGKITGSSEQIVSEGNKNINSQDLESFYLFYEDRSRGDEKLLTYRFKAYLPVLDELKGARTSLKCLDLGCGRGEWLGFLQNRGFEPFGIDLNPVMLEKAIRNGYDVEVEDALTFLKNSPEAHWDLISGFHIVEHLSFENLLELIKLSYRALKPGGMLLFETPNPENLIVGACNFYSDPTHIRPIPPLSLLLMMEFFGFQHRRVLHLSPMRETSSVNDAFLKDVEHKLYGPQDYAAIAIKPEREVT